VRVVFNTFVSICFCILCYNLILLCVIVMEFLRSCLSGYDGIYNTKENLQFVYFTFQVGQLREKGTHNQRLYC